MQPPTTDPYTQTGFSEDQRQETSRLRNEATTEPPNLETLILFLKTAQADLDKNRKIRNIKTNQQDVDFF